MAVIVIATPGAVDANSFQTVAEIDAYYLTRAPAAIAEEWSDAGPDEKSAAAISATIWMTALILWTGYQATSTQALPWPRTSMWYRDNITFIPSSVIPQELKNAHAEFSRILLSNDRSAESLVASMGLTSLKAGPIAMAFRDPAPAIPVMPSTVLGLLIPSWINIVLDSPSINRELWRA